MAVDLLNRKLEYWEHQLLDLGKRNKMINYRETKRTTIKLVEPSFGELFNRLAINEETLTFQRSVDRETDIRVFSILSLLENLSAPLPVTIGDIKTEGSALERQRTLKNLRAKSRLALEEQGTNILYLSFGFIEWKDGKSLYEWLSCLIQFQMMRNWILIKNEKRSIMYEQPKILLMPKFRKH